jgi:hypothetical protein
MSKNLNYKALHITSHIEPLDSTIDSMHRIALGYC